MEFLARFTICLLALGVCTSCARTGVRRPGASPAVEVSPEFIVKCFPVKVGSPSRPFFENTYLAYDPSTADALLVDPGARSAEMERWVEKRSLRVRAILNTHGHRDHIGGDAYYASKYQVPVRAHAAEKPYFEDTPLVVASLEEGILSIAGFEIRVLHTPGHSPGSVAYLVRGALFSGDTLFAGDIGRTWGDTPEEEQRLAEEEKTNIRNKLFLLPEETRVYPGHGLATTIGKEIQTNPYINSENP